MGHFRFRRSVKIAPGVKINFNKNSVSTTLGPKGAHYTINSKGTRTKSVGLPGTGLYYTETSKKKQKQSNEKAESHFSAGNHFIADKPSNKNRRNPNGIPFYKKTWFSIALLLLFTPIGLFLIWAYTDWKKGTKIAVSAIMTLFFVGLSITASNPSNVQNLPVDETPVSSSISETTSLTSTTTTTSTTETTTTPATLLIPEGAEVTNVGGNWGLYLNGELVDTFTGVASNENGSWYINNGLVDFGFSGKCVYNGMTYDVDQGKVIS